MSDIIEKNQYPATIPLIEVGDKVEGGLTGAANKQAISLADRTNFLKVQHDLLALKVGQLTPKDIGAEVAGAATTIMGGHLADPDPHNQYLLKTDAGSIYVELSGANLPGGYVQLNGSGKIPASLIDMIQSSYVVVSDQAARLALPQTANLTICVQADIDTLFYLNGNLNPAVASNWFSGQSATVSGVSRVYGRTGDITAQAGDYNADQITETINRRFLSAAEKAAYAAKQDKLVSGTNIRTFFQRSLLGTGDLTLTPQEMGCASTIHTHSVAEINDWAIKFSEQLASKLKPSRGISIGYNSSTGDVTIASAYAGEPSDGGRPYITAERLQSAAGQTHTFSFAPNNDFDLDAFAMKSEPGITNQSQLIDSFLAGSAAVYNKTNELVFDGMLSAKTISKAALIADGDLFSTTMSFVGKDLTLSSPPGETSIVPAMTSNTAPAGYTASSSSVYSGDFLPYKAFDHKPPVSDWCSNNSTVIDPLPWIQIDLPTNQPITGYRLTRQSTAVNFFMKSWKLQGSNDNGVTWADVHTVINNTQTAQTMTFNIGYAASYFSYRLTTIELTNSSQPVQLREFELLAPEKPFIINNNGKNYTIQNNALVEITDPITASLITARGVGIMSKLLLSNLTGAIKIISNAQFEINALVTPNPQIAVQKLATAGSRWGKIKAGLLTSSATGNGKIRLVVSRDLINWFAFNGTNWVVVDNVTPDNAGAAAVLANGISPSVFNALTEAQWASLYSDHNGQPDSIAFAFALSLNDANTDSAFIDQLSLTVDLASAWKKQNESEVEIRWYVDSVVFKTVTAGDYKLVYQIP